MKQTPKISIVTIAKNNCEGLQKTLKSIREQSWQDFEHIIVDGASTDETRPWLRTLEPQPEVWISEPDLGIYHAMNKGLEKCQGEWVYFLNAGDVLAEVSSLEQIARVMDQNLDIVYFDMYRQNIHGELQYWKQRKPIRYGLFNNICHQAVFYNRRLCPQLNYNTDIQVGADCDLLLKLLYQKKKLHYLKLAKPLAIYSGNGISQHRAHQALLERKSSFQQHMPNPTLRFLNQLNLLRQISKLRLQALRS